MSLILVRHGETGLNAARVMQPADTPLSPRGLAQAAAVGRRLAVAGAAAILSSDLPRARQTAEAIAAATGLAIAYTPLLHERNFGELRGHPLDLIRARLGFDPVTMPDAPPGGESWPVFQARVAQAFALALAQRRAAGGPLIVVSHGLVIGAMIDSYAVLPGGLRRGERIANTSVTVLAAEPPHAASVLDDTSHLDASAAADRDGLTAA